MMDSRESDTQDAIEQVVALLDQKEKAMRAANPVQEPEEKEPLFASPGVVKVVWLKPHRNQGSHDAFTTALVDQSRFVGKNASPNKLRSFIEENKWSMLDCEIPHWLGMDVTLYWDASLTSGKYNVLATNLAARLKTGAADAPIYGKALVSVKALSQDTDPEQICGMLFMIHNMMSVYLEEGPNLAPIEKRLEKLRVALGPT